MSEMRFPKLVNLADKSDKIIYGDEFSIGRSLNCTWILADLALSRVHCVISRVDGVWYVTDKSSNGTSLNNEKLLRHERYILKHQDLIHLTDNVKFQFISYEMDNNMELDDGVFSLVGRWASQQEKTMEVINLVDNSMMDTSSVRVVPINNLMTNIRVVPLQNLTDDPSKPGPSNLKPQPENAEMHNSFEDELTCSICTELFIKTVTLNCSHSFCGYCIGMWHKNHKMCPICRAKITCELASRTLDNIVGKLAEKMTEEERQRRQEIMKEREQSKQQAETAAAAAAAVVTVAEPQNMRRVGRGRRRLRMGTRGRPAGPGPGPIEISSDSSSSEEEVDVDDDEDEDDELAGVRESLIGALYEQDFDLLSMDEEDAYTGLPGHYYGGYGICYKCHQPGHWANGCPNRYY